MELHSFQTFSFQSLVHDALTLVDPSAALLAGFAFICLGFLLPGLLTALGGYHDAPRGAYLEFGPITAPTISELAPPRATDAPALQPSTFSATGAVTAPASRLARHGSTPGSFRGGLVRGHPRSSVALAPVLHAT